jgi:hypothetical protein
MQDLLNPVRGLLLATGLLAAQASFAQVSSGALSGRVAATDKVVVRNLATGLVREVPVKKDGSFWIRRLPVGTYEVTITSADGNAKTVMAAARTGTTTRVEFK